MGELTEIPRLPLKAHFQPNFSLEYSQETAGGFETNIHSLAKIFEYSLKMCEKSKLITRHGKDKYLVITLQ